MDEIKTVPSGASCSCPHHKMVPVLIFLIGLNFVLVWFGAYSSHASALIWPILLGLIGVFKLCGGMCKCCKRA